MQQNPPQCHIGNLARLFDVVGVVVLVVVVVAVIDFCHGTVHTVD